MYYVEQLVLNRALRASETLPCQWYNSVYVVHFLSGTIYSRGLEFVQVIASSSECSVQGQVFHCKLRHQGCSFTRED